jgi:hypothetical protein
VAKGSRETADQNIEWQTNHHALHAFISLRPALVHKSAEAVRHQRHCFERATKTRQQHQESRVAIVEYT